jgi:hypothetical protein
LTFALLLSFSKNYVTPFGAAVKAIYGPIGNYENIEPIFARCLFTSSSLFGAMRIDEYSHMTSFLHFLDCEIIPFTLNRS